MKLSISRETLLKNMRHMSAVVEKRTSIAILSNVRLVAADNKLETTATDNDIVVQGSTEAFVEQDGTTTVNAHKFFEIISKIPEGVMVNLDLTEGGNRLAISAGKAKFSLACLPADAFPAMTSVEDGVTFKMDATTLSRALTKAQFAASADDTRAYLTGVYMHIVENSGNDEPCLRFVATDGHRLAKVDLPLPEGIDGMPGVILPRKCVNELRKLTDEGNEISLTVGETKIQGEAGDITLTSKVIDGTFPDYDRVIPKGNNSEMAVARRTLLQAVDRVAILSHEKSRSIRFALAPDQLTISANNPDQENATEEVKVEYGADSFDIGFNAKYVSDIGSQIESDDIKFFFKDGTSPVLVKDASDASALFVVMPMRI
ncbi:MAG: DNA polymerase III subunit beta [Alphaproteobacteria bacterium]|nr:DNA polymerase III subunit beta [Alphaproteobacteria bacterium]MDD9920620.1 DNA polymerase III subunit beta [Alphaproteobacteria bacterium]